MLCLLGVEPELLAPGEPGGVVTNPGGPFVTSQRSSFVEIAKGGAKQVKDGLLLFFSVELTKSFSHNTFVLSGRGRGLWTKTEEVLLFRGRTRSRSGCGADSLLH